MLPLKEENALLKETIHALRAENERIARKAKVYFNNSDLGFVVLDAFQKVVEVNSTFEELFGYPSKEIVGEHFSKLFTTPQLYTTWCNNYVHFHSLESVSNLEYRLQKKSKVIFWAELFGRKFEDNNDEFSIWSIRDISLRVRSRNTIRNLNLKHQKQFEELQEILDVIPMPIFIKDKHFRYIGCNKALCQFFNIDKSTILGKMVFDIFPYDLATLYHEKDKEMSLTPYQTYKISVAPKDGAEEVALEIHKKRIMREGDFDGFVGVLIDVTQTQMQEQYLQNRVEEELSKNLTIQARHQEEMIRNVKFSSIGQMAAGITHEINTPLTYVKGNFEMLLEDIARVVPEPFQEEMLHDGKVIQEGLERIERIIQTMREASQKSSEKQEKVNLYETVISALILSHNRTKQIVRVLIDGKVFHMGLFSQERTFFCYVQKQRVEQVWIIILNNALDELIKLEHFNERTLHVTLTQKEETILVRICDNAGGIDASVLPRIFEPFESTKESSGIGIGLNIAHSIVTQNGGTIDAYNENGGAVIEVTFPLYKEEDGI
jgi:two-component system, LuxR family, sensor kinase FixL